MKSNQQFILLSVGFLIMILSGCSTVKEVGKGFMGVSTQVLEQKRSAALRQAFVLGYDDCFAKVKDILNTKDKESYVYAGGSKEKMLAVYLSPTDTTPVGIFFTEVAGGNTLIEISSPSTFAKEELAGRIFAELASYSLDQKENNSNVKEKTDN